MSHSKKYILFVGMGDWYVPQLEMAARKGYKSIVTNRNAEALALKKADIPIVVDGRDVYSILAFLYQNHLQDQIAYIYTGTELFLSTALLAQSLRIRWHSPHSAYMCENKNLMKEALVKQGIPHPKGGSVQSLSECLSFAKKFTAEKYICKPADGLSAQGVMIAETRNDIKKAFLHALNMSLSNTVVIEEYVDGSLHDINGILDEKGLLRLGINDKKAGSPPHAVVVEASAPTTLSLKLQEKAYTLFENACRALGLSSGPVKGDLILDRKENLKVLEVAPRFHGPLGSLYVIPEALGVNPFSELLKWQQNGKVKPHNIRKKQLRTVFASASETKRKTVPNGTITKVLKKPGIQKKHLWKSNYDVPYYIIWER